MPGVVLTRPGAGAGPVLRAGPGPAAQRPGMAAEAGGAAGQRRIMCVGLVCLDIISVVEAFPAEDSDTRYRQPGGLLRCPPKRPGAHRNLCSPAGACHSGGSGAGTPPTPARCWHCWEPPAPSWARWPRALPLSKWGAGTPGTPGRAALTLHCPLGAAAAGLDPRRGRGCPVARPVPVRPSRRSLRPKASSRRISSAGVWTRRTWPGSPAERCPAPAASSTPAAAPAPSSCTTRKGRSPRAGPARFQRSLPLPAGGYRVPDGAARRDPAHAVTAGAPCPLRCRCRDRGWCPRTLRSAGQQHWG